MAAVAIVVEHAVVAARGVHWLQDHDVGGEVHAAMCIARCLVELDHPGVGVDQWVHCEQRASGQAFVRPGIAEADAVGEGAAIGELECDGVGHGGLVRQAGSVRAAGRRLKCWCDRAGAAVAVGASSRRACGEGMAMPRHFGVLIPSTNTTVEIEYNRLLPGEYQAHAGRLKSRGGTPFASSLDADLVYQSQLLGTAKVEVIALSQTSASLFAEDYDTMAIQRMSEAAGVPAITSAQAVGQAVQALGARRIALVSPYSPAVIE